ncbi:hypothetical protein ACO0R3_002983 [Hanseniaspora guilliermondii]
MLRRIVTAKLSVRFNTFEGSTITPLKFQDLTSNDKIDSKTISSRKILPKFKNIPDIIKNSKNIPTEILSEISTLSKPPVMPELDECCGSGCEDNCVMVIYYKDFKDWKDKRHKLMEYLMKDEADGGINKREFDAIVDYLGIKQQVAEEEKEKQINNVIWPPKLKPGEWESPPLNTIEKKKVLDKEQLLENIMESKVPVDILQFDRLEQKLKAKKKRNEACA